MIVSFYGYPAYHIDSTEDSPCGDITIDSIVNHAADGEDRPLFMLMVGKASDITAKIKAKLPGVGK